MIARMLAGVAPPAGRSSSRWSTTARRRWRSSSATTRTSSSASSAARPGTTRDAFQLLADAQKYGAKVALFGRKINNAENQLAFVQFLRLIVDGVIGPVEAVKAYHAVLGKLGIRAAPLARRRPETPIVVEQLRWHGNVCPRIPAHVGSHQSPAIAKPHLCQCHTHESEPTTRPTKRPAQTDGHPHPLRRPT